METSKAEYEQKKPNIKLDFKPNTYEEAFNKSNQDFANQTGLYDIVLQYNFSLASYAKNNYVYDLEELKGLSKNTDYSFESDIFPFLWKEASYYYSDPKKPDPANIKPLSYPFAGNAMLLVYNKELFNNPAQKKAYFEKYHEELNVPQDLPTFYKVAAFFTQPDKNLYGLALEGAATGWMYYEWSSFLQGYNAKVLDKSQGWGGNANTPILIDSKEAIDGTNYYKSLKPFTAGNFFTVDGVEQRNILKKGNVAMGIIWSDYCYGLINKGDGTFDQRFGFLPTPGSKSLTGGGSFFINRKSKIPSEAFDYVLFVMSKEEQVKLVKKGLCSPRKSVYDDPSVQSVPYVPALKASMNRAEYMLEAGPDGDFISTTITKYIQKIWNGELSTEAGLKAAKKEIAGGRAKFFN